MTDATQVATPTVQSSEPASNAGGFAFLALICTLGAIGFAGQGVWRMYNEEQVVGGDAYNLLLAATRGVGLISVGLLLAIMACMFTILVASARRGA